MVEPLVMQAAEAGGYRVDGDLDRSAAGAPGGRAGRRHHQGRSRPTTSATITRVIEMAGGVPVLVRGGGRVSDEEILGAP